MLSDDRCLHRAKRRLGWCSNCDAFARLEDDKEFMAELKKVGGDDADLLLAKDAEPMLRQALTVTPGVQEFVSDARL
jgi:hypothetical protein